MRSRTGLVATVCAFVLFGAQTSQAAPTWLPATDLSATGADADLPDVSTNSDGSVVAIWALNGGIQVADRPAGGPFAAPQSLAPSGVYADRARVALDSAGDAVALFREYDGAHNLAYGTYRRAGQPWELPVPFSAPGQEAEDLRVAIGPGGAAMAAWQRGNTGQVAFRSSATGPWEAPQDFPASGMGGYPAVAFDSAGNAIVVWANETPQRIQSAFRAAGGTSWGSAVDVSAAGTSVYNPAVAFDTSGNALAAFIRGSALQAGKRSPGAGGSWQSPVDLSAVGENIDALMYPEVALAPDGQAVVVWVGTPALPYRARAAYRPSLNSAFEAPVDLSVPGQPAFEARVGMDATGNAVAIWHRSNGSNYIVQGSVKPSGGGAWSAPENLSAAGQTADAPKLSVDPQGNAIAVWNRSNGTNQIAQFAAYDGAGPLLRSLSVPSVGAPGQTLAFSVSPVDVWSSVASTGWSFGDGAGANGTSASHSYGGTGGYEATATSSDTLGNTTTASRSVAVSVPAVASPVISSASLTNKRFRVGRKATAISARLHRGTTFRFTLSAPATLTVTITGSARGLRRGRRCVKPTAGLRRLGAKRCKRKLRGGRLTRSGVPAGRGTLAFSGRIGRRALAAGSYRAVLRASNAAGRSRAVTLRFAVVR